MKKIKQIWIPSIKIKTWPHFPKLPSGSWQNYAKKFQLSPHIAARKKSCGQFLWLSPTTSKRLEIVKLMFGRIIACFRVGLSTLIPLYLLDGGDLLGVRGDSAGHLPFNPAHGCPVVHQLLANLGNLAFNTVMRSWSSDMVLLLGRSELYKHLLDCCLY